MNFDEGQFDNLISHLAEGLLDEKGRFSLDRGILRKHYSRLVADECESLSFLIRSTERQGARLGYKLNRSCLRLEMEFPEDSLLPQRLSKDPCYRLSAIFPPTHCLYEMDAGYNAMAFSEKTRHLSLATLNNTIVLEWQFDPDPILEASLAERLSSDQIRSRPI